MPKYIFVTGGVISGIGKGVIAGSIGKILQSSGIKVSVMKMDPYLNVDAGTMNPLVHGEVFVCDDGAETDMDIGTYERFLDINLSRANNITTGQVYLNVLQREREGKYLGKCVQIIPHITDEIKRLIRYAARKDDAEVMIVESGGTVGDIEALPFLEALRQMRFEEGKDNTLFVHVTLAPIIEDVGELKTKPTQHSVQELRRIGIQPDIIIVRSKKRLTEANRDKISLFTNVPRENVLSSPDLKSPYLVPQVLEEQGLSKIIFEQLKIPSRDVDLSEWNNVVKDMLESKDEVHIAMVGKYAELADSYVSVNHALYHAGGVLKCRVKIHWIESENLECDNSSLSELEKYDGIIVPGGFGSRGVEGKILAANYAREKGIPYLGLCFGLQLAVVSFARHVLGYEGANSTEIDPNTPYPVIDLLPEQKEIDKLGGTMRLGGHNIILKAGTLAFRLYGKNVIRERHRHRYEINPKYWNVLQEAGMVFSGFSEDMKRVEIIELKDHPFYMASQYHPEFVSRPGKPDPIFRGFVEASLMRRKSIGVSLKV
ncbi:MAG: CTP synthase [Nitrososphaeria archaeon]